MSKKNKKEKVIYYDDGSTISDMSNLSRKKQMPTHTDGNSFVDKAKTFFRAMKMMFLPMLVFVAGICLVFGIVYILFSILG